MPGDGAYLSFGATQTANRVTAVPRRSWKVTPVIPAAAQAFRHDDLKPSEVQGILSVLVRIRVLRLGVASSAAFRGAPTGITTRAFVLPWRKRIWLPS